MNSMAVARGTHDYEEAVQTQFLSEKIGEHRLLWGAIVIPKVRRWIEKNLTGKCKYCGHDENYYIHTQPPVNHLEANQKQ